MNMTYADFLYINVQPAEAIKLACEETKSAMVIEDGVIVDIVKEN